MRSWFFNIAWVLVALLIIGASLISAGAREGKANPKVTSYGASGLTALASLLEENGYQVSSTGRPSPRLSPRDVIIGFQPKGEDASGNAEQILATDKVVETAVKKGATAFWLPLDSNFESSSASNEKPQAMQRFNGKPARVTGSLSLNDSSGSAVALVKETGKPFIAALASGSGYQINYGDGIGLTNRFIDSGDNAEVFFGLLKAYAPEARRVVFVESTYGLVQAPGLLETIGPWAEGSWYQLLFFFFIVVITLNQRFGLPRRPRKVQTGGRELIDAFTDTLVRAKATGIALESSAARADLQVRSLLKMPRDASEGERNRILPPELVSRLSEVQAASNMPRVRPADAFKLIVALENEVEKVASSRRSSEAPKRRRRKS